MTTPTKFGPITISARAKDDYGKGYIVAEWTGNDGQKITAAVPEKELLTTNGGTISRIIYELFQTTINPTEAKDLVSHLNALGRTTPRTGVLVRCGWNDQRTAYLIPGRLFGDRGQAVLNLGSLSGPVADKFRVRGSLEDWQSKVVPLIQRNSRLILGAVLSFCGPIIQFMGEEHFMVSLLGGAGQGKTTIGAVASMIWGAHQDPSVAKNLGAGETFKSTINALDEVYAAHSGCFLFIDELSTYLVGSTRSSNALPELVRSHNDGKGKKRLTDETPPPSWLLPVLVSSNESLAQLSPALGVESRDAIRDRYIEIPAPSDAYGMFEDLHGAKTLGGFVVELKSAALANAGAPAEAFLKKLVVRANRVDAEPLLNVLTRWKGEFMSAAKDIQCHERLKRRFAIMYAAGRTAIAAKVLPLNAVEIEEALLICLRDHLEALSTEEAMPSSLSDVVRAIKRYYQKHQKMMPDITEPKLREGKHDPDVCAGYLKTTKANETELLLPRRAFDEAMANIISPDEAKRLLREADLVVVQREGPNSRTSVKRILGRREDGSKWEISVFAIRLNLILDQAN